MGGRGSLPRCPLSFSTEKVLLRHPVWQAASVRQVVSPNLQLEPSQTPTAPTPYTSVPGSSKGKRGCGPASFPGPQTLDLLPQVGTEATFLPLLTRSSAPPSTLKNHLPALPTPSIRAAESVQSHRSRPVPPPPRDSEMPSPTPSSGEGLRRCTAMLNPSDAVWGPRSGPKKVECGPARACPPQRGSRRRYPAEEA